MSVASRIATIMKIGYQPEMTMPTGILRFLARFSQNATEFLNQMRYARKYPVVTTEMLDYLFHLRALSTTKLQDALGWQPILQPDFSRAVEYLQQHGRELFRLPVIQQQTTEHIQQQKSILDSAAKMITALENYRDTEGNSNVIFSLFSWEIDVKSLWIFVETSWHYLIPNLLKQNNSRKLSILWPQWGDWLADHILSMIRYYQNRAREMFPEDLSSQVQWLSQQLGSLNNLPRLHFYLKVVLMSEVIQEIHKWVQKHARWIRLLPEKNYGILLSDERGDIGMVFRVKGDGIKVDTPRKQLDLLTQFDSLSRKIAEFKKSARLHIVFGARLERVISALLSASPGTEIVKNLGKHYFLSEWDDYSWLSHMFQESLQNIYLFLDRSGQVSFGVKRCHYRIETLSPGYVDMVNTLLSNIEDHDEIVQMLATISSGREQAVLIKENMVKRILEALISPSRLHKVLIRILEKTMQSKDTEKHTVPIL